MTGVVWKVTQYGVEADGFEIDIDRLAKIKRGRYRWFALSQQNPWFEGAPLRAGLRAINQGRPYCLTVSAPCEREEVVCSRTEMMQRAS